MRVASAVRARIRGPVLGAAARCRPVLDELPQWFGIPSAFDEYEREIDFLPTWPAVRHGAVVGFTSGDQRTTIW